MRTTRLRTRLGAAALALALVTAACGGGDDDTSDAPADSAVDEPDTSDEPAEDGDDAAEPADDAGDDDATDTTEAEEEFIPAGGGSSEIKLEDADYGEPVEGGTLRLLLRLDANQFDPAVTTDTTGVVTGAQVYEGLVENFRGEISPALAESWEVSDDQLTYTFDLRDGVVFHSGKEMTADDVVFSLNRVMDPATNSPNINSYDPIASVEAPDPDTVVITLDKPHAPIMYLLASLSSSIIDQDVLDAGGIVAPPSGGTGPFMLSEHNVGRDIQLVAHEDYWQEGKPYLDGIEITWNPDDNARAAAIRSNSVDVLFRPAPEFIESLKEDPSIKWYGGSGSLSLNLLMNSSVEPFDDERVRQAVFYALDRQVLLDVANSGYGIPLNAGHLPPDRMGGLEEPVYGAPDIEKSKALLAEAGYPDGFDVELTVIATSAFQVRQAEVEQQQLAEVGINVTLNPVEAQVATDATRSGDFEMYQSGFGLRADPDERASAAFGTGGGLNYANWSDPEFDALLEEARAEGDPAVRDELYQQADMILATRGPAAFTILTADFDVMWEDVYGYYADPTPTFGVYRFLWMSE